MYKIKSFLQETKNQFDLKSINQCPCNFIRHSLNDSHHTPHYYTIKYCFQYLFIIIVIAILLIYLLLNTIFDFCVFFFFFNFCCHFWFVSFVCWCIVSGFCQSLCNDDFRDRKEFAYK